MSVSILDRRAARDYKKLTEPYALTPAVRAALAYIAITGNTAKGTQVDTRVAALHYAEDSDYERTGRFYTVPEQNAAHYQGTPLGKAHAALLAAGFEFRGYAQVLARKGGLRSIKNLRYTRLDNAGDGFSADVEPSGYLYWHVVKGYRDLWSPGQHGRVPAKQAGTLPVLFSAVP